MPRPGTAFFVANLRPANYTRMDSIHAAESPWLILGESIVSNADGNQPDPNELNLPDNEEQFEALDLPGTDGADPLGGLDFGSADGGDPLGLGQTDGGATESAPEESGAIGDVFESMPAEADADVESAEPESSDKPQAEPREGIGMAGFAVFGFCGLSIVLLVALDAMVFMKWGFLFMLLMNVFWLIGTAIPFVMWMGRKTLNFFEVALGLSLAGILVAVSLLLMEMVDYGGEVKPKGTVSAVQSPSDRTIAVA